MKKLRFLVCLLALLAQNLSGDLHVNTSQSMVTGDSVTAWENFVGPGNNIFVSSQVAGVWSTSTGIGDPFTFPTSPHTAMNNLGDQVVIWLGYDLISFTQSLYGSFYVSGSWVTSLISDPTLEYVIGNYQVKIADDGSTVVTWAGYMFSDGSNQARAIYAPTYGTWPAPFTIL